MATRLGEFLVGTQGLALLRGWLVADPEKARRRFEEVRRFVAELESGPAGIAFDVAKHDVVSGYEAWATSYDERPNPLIRLEEPVVHRLLERCAPGRALDAACGTGRHAAVLYARGHEVVGVDASPAMLERARKRLPGASFHVGALDSLPVDTDTTDVVVCALALSHLDDLRPAMGELGRVARPGATVVVSDFHPGAVAVGGQGFFQASDGRFGFVPSVYHPVGDYLSAARAAGLELRECIELHWGEEEVRILAGPMIDFAPEAFLDAFLGMPGALVLDFVKR